jgi:hypothetical protein
MGNEDMVDLQRLAWYLRSLCGIYQVLIQANGTFRPRDQRKEQEHFRSSMNRRATEDTLPADELVHALERVVNAKSTPTSRHWIWIFSGARLKSLATMTFTNFRVSRFASPGSVDALAGVPALLD